MTPQVGTSGVNCNAPDGGLSGVVWCPISAHAEPGNGADAFQRPLRSRFRARLTAGVAMTSDVKKWQQLFLGF
jgi:hypothetical protein